MEPFLSTCAAIAVISGTAGPGDYSTMIATDGLRATEAALAARTDPTPDDLFALGGLRFLGAIERALQLRYQNGMSHGFAVMADIPVLRLPIEENPSPVPFDPAAIEAMFLGITQDMTGALAALDQIGDDDALGVSIRTDDLWFDINSSGQRDECEGMLDVVGLGLTGGFGEPLNGITIRFDTADAAWLSAYAHLLSGISETVLAFQPAEAIGRVLDSRAAIEALSPLGHDSMGYMDMQEITKIVDLVTMFVYALEGQPDIDRSRAAHAHFQAMIADNRVFWNRVALEADNDAEWIPNKSQTSALPIDFPSDTGGAWLSVLAELEGVLRGDVLIPYWTLGDGAGINMAKLFQDPPPVDIVGFVQGGALVPYMERGRLVSFEALQRFQEMVRGNAGLYMIILN